MVSFARATQTAEQASGRKTEKALHGRNSNETAGQQPNAQINNEIVAVYRVPVDSWCVSNIATSSAVEYG